MPAMGAMANGEGRLTEPIFIFSLALGPHPQRELTLIPRPSTSLGTTLSFAEGSPRRYMAATRHGRGRFFTGAGAPPSARTDAQVGDVLRQRTLRAARYGRQTGKRLVG